MPRTGFPAGQKTVKLVYQDYDTPFLRLNTTSSVTWNTYNINGAYDPNPAFLSGSIPGFDEWAAVYANYRVTWCRITCTFTQNIGNPACYIGIYLRPITGETGFTLWKQWLEIAGNPQPNRRAILGNAAGSANTRTLSVKSGLGKLIGQKSMLRSDVGYSASTLGNPPNILQGFTFIATMDGNPPPAELVVYCNCRVTYYVTFWNRRTLKS